MGGSGCRRSRGLSEPLREPRPGRLRWRSGHRDECDLPCAASTGSGVDDQPPRDYTRAMPMPLEIIGLGKREVRFVWEEGGEDVWSARQLRLMCTCANCQSEATGERLLDPKSVPEDIIVSDMHLVGNYGVGVHFSDGHTTGIFRF